MKEFDLIAIGTGSVLTVVDAFLQRHPAARVAVIDKDVPGGICLTRGCIPSKILLYSADLVRTIERSSEFGVDAPLRKVRFPDVMDRMRTLIGREIDSIRRELTVSPNIEFFPAPAEFTGPATLSIAGQAIRGKTILLGTGSEPLIPPIPGLAEAGYLTSDTLLGLSRLPRRLVVLGGGYIAAEYGHFCAAMGAEVTIVGRNPQFLPAEEPEVSAIARRALERHLRIRTNQEVTSVRGRPGRLKEVTFSDRTTGGTTTLPAEELLVAVGRGPTSKILHPERAGIRVDPRGWIVADDHLRASAPDVWVLGDATGVFPFKHKANYDARVVHENLVLGRDSAVDYHAVPHAVFTHPEIAGVGLREHEATAVLGEDRLLVGFCRFADTARGEAMGVEEGFVKVIVEREGLRIVGAHIVGPEASVLIQEVVTLMNTPERSARPIQDGMHIHPALSEVVQRAFLSLMPPEHAHHHIGESLSLAAA